MLRAVLESVFRPSKKPIPKTPANPTRFAPALQALEAREVPAVLAFATAELSLPDTDGADAAVTADAEPTAKVTYQDFHFTAKVSKSSPK